MLRYQTSIHSNHHVDSRDSESFHSYSQPSTIASSNGPKAQQSRLIKRQSTTAYKSVPTCRLAPRRRYFVMDNHKSSMSGGGQSISFPGPDYLKRMKENYESGKIIYIRRPTGVNNSSIPSKMTSVINNSIRSTTYHTTTTSSNGKLTMETNGNVPKYVFRLPKNEFTKFDENRPQSNMYVPAYEPLKVQYTTVPACMSMGGEYVYEEEIEETELENDLKSEDLMPASPPSSGLITPKCESLEESSLSVNSLSLTSGNYSNNQSFKVLPMKNRLQPTKFTCPQPDCFWRGPTDLSLRKHIQVHGLKQPVIYNGNKTNLANNGDPMKVQLVQPKPKGVKCSECDTFAYSRPLLLRHMHDAHGIEAPLIRRTFANREMLQTWLDSLRETHAVEFVVSSGSKKWGRGLQVHYLTCSRSGDQKERPNKKYVRPPRPSIKCGRNCMAYLKIKQNPTVSELQIEGCLHHSGHEIDHSRMMLEPNELASIGEIVEIVNEGMDIMNNADALRGYLGNSGRFRLVSDRGIIEQMPVWFEQYNRAMSEYMNDGNQGPGNMYRGSGALSLSSVMPNSYCSSGPLVPITPATAAGPRKLSLGKTVVKRETDFSMPIRFGNPGMQNKQINKTGISMLERNDHQINFNKMHIFDETKVKVEIDEDTLAAANLLKDDYGEFKTENIFDSPMIGGENSLVDENRVLVNSSRDMAASSGLNEMLSASSSDLFSNDFSSVDDINTDFNCAMDDAEFNQLLGFSDFNDRSINCS